MTLESLCKTLIIAEAGVNHNGSIELAKSLIYQAAKAGANIVKFQTFTAKSLVTQSASKAAYQLETTKPDESQEEMIGKLELSEKMHVELIQECEKYDIRFASTGFDEASVDLLIELGAEFLKIPSGEITNLPYLRHAGSKELPIIISTGMASLQEVADALSVLESSGTPRNQITVLHCNTEYPTPIEDVNLNAMLTMREEFGIDVGYSDHTLGIEVPIAAVAMGATVIEKHFTLDRAMPGPDHAASLEPDELKQMVKSIRNIEKAMGNGVKKPSKSEKKNIEIARKSIVASQEIMKGDFLTKDNLAVKRPGSGISPMEWDHVIGQKASKDFAPDDLIVL